MRIFLALLMLVMAGACGMLEERDRAPRKPRDVSNVPDAVPKPEPLSRYGNPAVYEVNGRRYAILKTSAGYREQGIASWYGEKFHGRRTSSGEIYDMYRMTAAHRSLPLPSYVRVTNLENKRSVVVRVNDRGPFHENRVIDLSYAAAKKLGIAAKGTGFVYLQAIDPRTGGFAGDGNQSVPSLQHHGIYLQVGAFREWMNASRIRQRVARLAVSPVAIKTSVDGGRQLYRVHVGPLTDVERIDRVVRGLNSIGIYDHHLVVE
jgi:rare lipoprotein A